MDISMIIIWTAVLIGTVALEAVTVQFVSIWFSVSAVFSLVLAGLNAPVWVQLVVFSAISVILLISTRPLVKKLKKEPVNTNFETNIGKTAVVTDDIQGEYSSGRATVGGVSWMAVSTDGSSIEKGETVKIMDISGAKLIVSKISN